MRSRLDSRPPDVLPHLPEISHPESAQPKRSVSFLPQRQKCLYGRRYIRGWRTQDERGECAPPLPSLPASVSSSRRPPESHFLPPDFQEDRGGICGRFFPRWKFSARQARCQKALFPFFLEGLYTYTGVGISGVGGKEADAIPSGTAPRCPRVLREIFGLGAFPPILLGYGLRPLFPEGLYAYTGVGMPKLERVRGRLGRPWDCRTLRTPDSQFQSS